MRFPRIFSNSPPDSGVSLVELLLTISMVGIIAYTGVALVGDLSEDYRIAETRRRLDKISQALIGDPRVLEAGKRASFGYFNDVGAAPSALTDLVTKPAAVSAFGTSATERISTGWRGPYWTASESGDDLTVDAWGNAWVTDFTSEPWTVQSKGSDGAVGGTGTATDLGVRIPASLRSSTVYGRIRDIAGTPISTTAEIELYQPNGTGGVQTRSATLAAGDAGAFSFTNAPIGWRAIKVWVPSKAAPAVTIGPALFLATGANLSITPTSIQLTSALAPLAIDPTTLAVVTGSAIDFSATGGTEPYDFVVTSGSGTIADSTLGDYTAPAAPGTDTIVVTDAAGATSTATITVYAPLTLSAGGVTQVAVGGTVTFSATGGLGTRTFAVTSGGGTINSSSGVFTAPAAAGTSIISVSDSGGNSVSASITIASTLAISPKTLKIGINSTKTFTSILGTGAKTYSVVAGSGSVVAGSGLYTAPASTGTTTVRVTDASGNTDDATLTIIKPIQVASAPGGTHHCVLYSDNTSVRCFGGNSSGQLGIGGTSAIGDATGEMGTNLAFTDLGLATGETITKLAAGTSHTCALTSSGTLKCWGLNGNGQLGINSVNTIGDLASEMGTSLVAVNVGSGKTVKDMFLGPAHTCAILNDDTLKCWGRGNNGVLGQGSTTDLKAPPASSLDLGALDTVKSGAFSGNAICVILTNDTVRCWGSNRRGQLGIGNTNDIGDAASEMGTALAATNLGAGFTPSKIVGFGTTTTNGSFCVMSTANQVKCWGYNTNGQMGINSTTGGNSSIGDTTGEMPPAAVSFGAKTPSALFAGGSHACVINSDSTASCWGLNTFGQTGDGSTTSPRKAPVTAAALGATPSSLHLVTKSTCYLSTVNRLRCWGQATNGELGSGGTSSVTAIPATWVDL